MKILSNFFQSIGQWFVDFFTNLWNWFTSTGEDGTKVSYLTRTIICIFIIVVAWIVISLIVKGAKRALRFKKAKSIDVSASSFAIEVIKVVLWLLVAFLVIWILGIDVSSLAGIVSAVTVALGLALQDLIGMFAAGVVLLRNKNFKTGDYISIKNTYGEIMGTVYRVGILYTSLNTVDGQRAYVSNSTVIQANVLNYTLNPNRRLLIKVPVAYNSDVDKVKEVLLNIMINDQRINRDPSPFVYLDNFDDSSLSIAVRCQIPYQLYWDVMFDIKESILKAFRENDIKIPYKTIEVIDVNDDARKSK